MAPGALRLTLLLFLLGLAASRLGLLLHELAGHAGVAALFGCRLDALRLFVFGGGYVGYDCAQPLLPAQRLAVDQGGIALELVVGALLYAASRRREQGLAGLALAGFGLLYLLHGGFYLVTGVHDGVGDGRSLHGLLGAARAPLVALGSLVLVGACFGFARGLARRLAPSLAPAAPRARLALLAGALLAATAAHAGLMKAEQGFAADQAYAASFRPQREVEIDAQLRRYAAERPRTHEELGAQRRTLETRSAQFPLTPLLGTGMALASLAGLGLEVLRRRAGEPAAPPWCARSLRRAGALCAVSLGIVIALDRLL